jgi:hypothetical protein
VGDGSAQLVSWLGYGLDYTGFETRYGKEIFSLLQNVQNGSGAHPASCSVGAVVISLGIKRLGREVDHLFPSSDEVKNEWSYTSTSLPQYPQGVDNGWQPFFF